MNSFKWQMIAIVFLIFGWIGIEAATPTIDYGNGFDSAGLQLNGSSTLVGDRIQLTNLNSGSQVGSIFAASKVNVERFYTEFEIRVPNASTERSGGLAFVIQNGSATATGNSSGNGSMGHDGIANKYAMNLELRERIFPVYHSWLRSGDTLRVQAAYDGTNLYLRYISVETNSQTFRTVAVNIPSQVNGSTAWVGFTAGTGSSSNQRSVFEVLNWSWFAGEENIPPMARMSANHALTSRIVKGTLRIRQGDTITFRDEESFSPSAGVNINSYAWDFGDGNQATGSVVSHTYNDIGSYSAQLVVTDADGNNSSPVPLKVEVSPSLEPVIDADRVTGVAPLSISFSATETAGLSDGDYINSTFNWNFDSTGIDSVDDEYEQVSAMVAGHVFTEPGTYVVTLDVIDKKGYEASESIEIVVTDIEDIPGLTTYHFAADGNDSNPGTMALPKRSMDEAADVAGANVRILFRKGDIWEHNSTVFRNIPGPFYWGAYEDPESPSEALPIIRSPEVNGANKQVSFVNAQDVRVVDLRFEATGNTYNPLYVGGISLGGVENQFILLQGLEFYNMGRDAIGLEGDSLTVYQCHGWDMGAYFAFAYRTSLVSFIGNRTEGIGIDYPEHVLRFADGYQTFIGFNHFQSWNTKSNIQLRGIGNANGVIYHNILDRESGVNPTNASSEEYVYQHVWEGNDFIYRFELEPLGYNPGPAVVIRASNIVLRNNRLHNYGQFIRSDVHAFSGRPRNIYVENNAMIVEAGVDHDPILFRGVEVDGELVIRNNIVYNLSSEGNVPGSTVLKFSNMHAEMTIEHNLFYSPFWDADTDLFEINNSSQTVGQWNAMGYGEGSIYELAPSFVSMEVMNENYLFPTIEGAQVDAGASVPVWVDFEGTKRPQGNAHDIGPWEIAGDGNSFPVASMSANIIAGEVPLEVEFSAEASTDPDEDPLTYEWDFDDGNGFVSGAETETRVFEVAGLYDVLLRVSDGSRTDIDSIQISVTEVGAVAGVSVSPLELSMEVGETAQLTAIVLPEDAHDSSVEWSSGNLSVATVDETGLVTAVADGSSVITVTTNDGGYTASTTVVVGDANVALGKVVTVDSNHNASRGGSVVVDGNSNPEDETRWVSANSPWPHWVEIDLEENYSINRLRFWSGGGQQYSDPFDFIFQYWDGSEWVDIVERTGNTQSSVEEVFSPVTTQRVRLYGTGGGDSLMRVYEIEVYAGEGEQGGSVTGVSINESDLTLFEGEDAQLTVTVFPEHASDKSVKWSSDKPDVVSVDINGRITALTPGVAEITATTNDGGFTASATITSSLIPTTFYDAIGAEPTANPDEYYSDWFGGFYANELYKDWIWHEGFGWIYTGLIFHESEMWLWSLDLQTWLFTHKEFFPFYWVPEEGWYYYGGVWSEKGWRYDFNAMRWIGIEPPSHPYLFFSAKDIPAIRNRMEKPAFQARRSELLQTAEALLNAPPISGSTGQDSRYSQGNSNLLAFAYIVTGDIRFAERAIEEVMVSVSLSRWTNPDNAFNRGADLRSSERTVGAALVYDWCYDVMSEEEREAIRNGILEKGIEPYLETLDPNRSDNWYTYHPVNNWRGVSHGGSTVGALALYFESERAREAVKLGRVHVPLVLREHFLIDSGGHEGVSYNNYGIEYALIASTALQRIFGDQEGLLRELSDDRLGAYWDVYMHAPDHYITNFGRNGINWHRGLWGNDDTDDGGPHSMRAALADTMVPGGDQLLRWAADNGGQRFYWRAASPFYFLWRRDAPGMYKEPRPELQEAVLFRGAGHAIMQSEELYVALSGGATHNRGDLGALIIVTDDERLLPAERLLHLPDLDKLESAYQSTILVNGNGQNLGGPPPKGEFLRFGSGEDFHYALLDMQPVYGSLLNVARRHLVMIRGKYIVLLDEVSANSSATIESRFQTQHDVEILEDGATILANYNKLHFSSEGFDTIQFGEGSDATFNHIRLSISDQDATWLTVLYPTSLTGLAPDVDVEDGKITISQGIEIDEILFTQESGRWWLSEVNGASADSIPNGADRSIIPYRDGRSDAQEIPKWLLESAY